MNMKGLSAHRLLDNSEERQFAEAWDRVNGADRILDYLLDPYSGTANTRPASARDVAVAAIVVQWLGTALGQAFLRDLGYVRAAQSDGDLDASESAPDRWNEARGLCTTAQEAVPPEYTDIQHAIERADWRLGDRDAASADVYLSSAVKLAKVANLWFTTQPTPRLSAAQTDVARKIAAAWVAVRYLVRESGLDAG